MGVTDALEVFDLKGIFVDHQRRGAANPVNRRGLGGVEDHAFYTPGVLRGDAIKTQVSPQARLTVGGREQHNHQRVFIQDSLVFVEVMNNRFCNTHDDLLVSPAKWLRVR